MSEFVALEDGRRVILHEDRGFTLGSGSSGVSDVDGFHGADTVDSITRNVLTVVLPDDDACEEDHPWAWLAELARARGLDVTEADLRRLPYEVLLTEEVSRWLRRV